MRDDSTFTAFRVVDEAGRQDVIEVLRATYQQEKGWVGDSEQQIPVTDLQRTDISWFVVKEGPRPIGVLRVLFDPPLAAYANYGFKMLDSGINIEAFIKNNRIAEIGRFAVLPAYRGRITVATALMRAATADTVDRGFTHLITDVFEDDPHSPYGFHTRVMGFHPVATHDVGELRSKSRRITLVLDIKAAYKRLKGHKRWLFRQLTSKWEPRLHRLLVAS
jgi:ribosomal protein S18 acetylase RimI-like enzyme